MSSLLTANKVQANALCILLYLGVHKTAIISLLNVKYRIEAVLFSGTMQIAASLLKQVINIFFNPPSTVLSTTVTVENHNG